MAMDIINIRKCQNAKMSTIHFNMDHTLVVVTVEVKNSPSYFFCFIQPTSKKKNNCIWQFSLLSLYFVCVCHTLLKHLIWF